MLLFVAAVVSAGAGVCWAGVCWASCGASCGAVCGARAADRSAAETCMAGARGAGTPSEIVDVAADNPTLDVTAEVASALTARLSFSPSTLFAVVSTSSMPSFSSSLSSTQSIVANSFISSLISLLSSVSHSLSRLHAARSSDPVSLSTTSETQSPAL